MPTAQTFRDLGHLPTVYQIVYALNRGTLGRRTLVELTSISEMTVRTHLGKLRRAGLVEMSKAGTTLTAKGLATFDKLFERVVSVGELELEELALDRHNAAAVVRRLETLRESWRYRDAAVREGATGVLLLVKRPDVWGWSEDPMPLVEQNPHDASYLESRVQAQAGDGLIIAFGPSLSLARYGLWSVLVELIPLSFSQNQGGA